MSAGSTMAKKRTTKRGPQPGLPGEQRDELVAIRCRGEWKEWIQEFADRERSTPTNLIDKAMAELANLLKFKAPPRR